jgi:hypothetical protein
MQRDELHRGLDGMSSVRSDAAHKTNKAGPPSQRRNSRCIPFREIASMSSARALDIVSRWLPGGNVEKLDYVVRNPTRADKNPGSFRICVRGAKAGVWADFATGDKGSDLMSLHQYLTGETIANSARAVARMVGHEFANDGGDNGR